MKKIIIGLFVILLNIVPAMACKGTNSYSSLLCTEGYERHYEDCEWTCKKIEEVPYIKLDYSPIDIEKLNKKTYSISCPEGEVLVGEVWNRKKSKELAKELIGMTYTDGAFSCVKEGKNE